MLRYAACGCRRLRAQRLMDRDQWHQNMWVIPLLLVSYLPAVVLCNEAEPLVFHPERDFGGEREAVRSLYTRVLYLVLRLAIPLC